MDDRQLQRHSRKTRILWRRFWAQLVDATALVVITPLVNQFLQQQALIGESRPLVSFVLVVIAYHTLFEGLLGWTPGKLLAGIKVVQDGTTTPPGLSRALVRSVLRLVDGHLFYLVGWAVAMGSEKGQRFGDMLGGTQVTWRRMPTLSSEHYANQESLVRVKQVEELREKDARIRSGKEGERRVREELSPLCLEDRYYLFNDLHEPAVGNIDHLVIGPCGMVLVETKANWGSLTLADDALVLINDAELARDPLVQVSSQMAALDQRFDYKTGFHPGKTVNDFLGYKGHHWVLCFSRAWVEGPVGKRRARQVVMLDNLQHHIRSYEAVFDQREIDYLARQVRDSYSKLPDSIPGSGTDVERAGAS